MLRKWALTLLVTIFILSGLFVPWPFKGLPLPVRSTLDTLHLPLFFVITIWCAWMMDFKRSYPAALVALIFAIVVECIQPLTGRSAEWHDLVNGLLGIVLALILLKADNLDLVRKKMAWCGVGILFAFLTIAPVFPPTAAYFGFRSSFPVLSDFNYPWYRYLWIAGLDQRDELDCDIDYERKGDLPFSCTVGTSDLSTIQFTPGTMDWSNYSLLELDLATAGAPLELQIRIDDSETCKNYVCRFNSSIVVPTERRKVQVPFLDPAPHRLNLKSIIRVILFTTNEEAGRSFDLYSMRLLSKNDTVHSPMKHQELISNE